MKIAIWGLGVTGRAVLDYCIRNNYEDVIVINRGDPSSWGEEISYPCVSEEKAFKELNNIDQIIVSPGVDLKSPRISDFRNKNIPIIGEIEFAFQKMRNGKIIAVTGTNGKTTTVKLIAKALELAGKKVFLGGNIGTPFIDAFKLDDDFDFYVLELSSFQLETIVNFRPDIAAILNITESHMERYQSFEEYKQAKHNIFKNMTKRQLRILPTDIRPYTSFTPTNTYLRGEHSLKNLWVCQKILNSLGIIDIESLFKRLDKEFIGADYRFQFKKVGDIDFINDAKSTNFDATIAALKSLENKDVVLIMGGQLREENLRRSEVLASFQNIKNLYLIGESATKMSEIYQGDFDCKVFVRLEDVLRDLEINCGCTVLFSPGFPSFDQYRNYLERGEQFNKLVDDLFNISR